MTPFTAVAPAKINLFLAITGRRPDGFHDLVSVVAPLTFGDRLDFEPVASPDFSLESDVPDLACDESNLVMRAARLFAAESGWKGGGRFHLAKRIPMGAGLGGGSSDAVAALRLLNEVSGGLLPEARLAALSANLGSDCPLFFSSVPIVMRGRGEHVEPLAPAGASRLAGRRLIVFKPAFGISTPWAYRKLAEGAPDSYLPAQAAETRLRDWIEASTAPVEALLFNSMEAPAFRKYPALPALLGRLGEEFGLKPLMSGSGSACFAFLPDSADLQAIETRIRTDWGENAFVKVTSVAGFLPGAPNQC